VEDRKRRSKGPNKKKKKNKKKWIILSLLLVVLIIAGIGIGYTASLLGKVDSVKIDEEQLDISKEVEEKYKNTDITNILLLGIDSEDGETGRSDSIMILSVDNVHNKLKLSSIMRDSYVDIKGHGKDKINHAYAFGGPELSISTINTNFDLNIKDFATVNFDSLPKVVDQLGGIDLNITSGDLKYINGYIDSLNGLQKTSVSHIANTGTQHVNGTQALAYARIRYDGGDQERTHRHRIILEALFNTIKSTSKTQYPSILNELLPLVKTSLNSGDILKLATSSVSLSGGLVQDRFPRDDNGAGQMINGVYYQTFDKAKTVEQMHQFIFES
jgi:polyisoprenyl-teichoic acid--peptidoglycan teichoic acid transferase